ncbi:MAG: hypothetical protein Q9173_003038 [Seirophora scorigena]
MVLPWCLSWSHQSYWAEFSLKGIKIEVKAPEKDAFPRSPAGIPPYFWGRGLRNRFGKLIGRKPRQCPFPIHPGYSGARSLIGKGTAADLEKLSIQARDFVAKSFGDIGHVSETLSLGEVRSLSSPESGPTLVQLRLSSDLERWKEAQHAIGNIIPPKGAGLLRGAADAPTMFSNYVTDMVFYYEHGYNYVFPSLESLLQKGLADPHALRTPGGRQRRDGICVGKQYIRGKIALEKQRD